METIINGFKTNRAFAVTSVLVLVLIAIAFAAPVLAPYDPTHATMQDAFMAPGGSHLFGTDKLGRDCFSRVLYGARASLSGVLFLVASVFIGGFQGVSEVSNTKFYNFLVLSFFVAATACCCKCQ
jgi:peptide/nickel transport system permease protein